MDRSIRPEVRNPVLNLPSMAKVRALSPEAQEALRDVLLDITIDARRRAQESWRKNKGPMAAYWKAVGAYTNHMRNAIRRAALSDQEGM